jgi:hypothetical protein
VNTTVTISIQRAGQFNVGTSQIAGGAFEVGDVEANPGRSINFALVIDGPQATFVLGRGGFFGLGAGVVNKQGNANGDAQLAENPVLNADGTAVLDEEGFPIFRPDRRRAWQVQALYNVNAVTLDLVNGIFDDSIIANGSDSNASLFAIGPSVIQTVNLGDTDVVDFRGGGNMMFVPALPAGRVYRVNVWDFSGQLRDGESYCILSSGPIILDNAPVFSNNTTLPLNFPTAEAFFAAIFCQPLADQNAPAVDFSETDEVASIAFTNESDVYGDTGNEIFRVQEPSILGDGDLSESLGSGVLTAQTADGELLALYPYQSN